MAFSCCAANSRSATRLRRRVIGTFSSGRSAVVDTCVDTSIVTGVGISGTLGGFDEKRKAMVLRFPKELEKAYQAGKSLVAGEG